MKTKILQENLKTQTRQSPKDQPLHRALRREILVLNLEKRQAVLQKSLRARLHQRRKAQSRKSFRVTATLIVKRMTESCCSLIVCPLAASFEMYIASPQV